MLWTAGVLLVACAASIALQAYVSSRGPARMLELLREDLDGGARLDDDARRHFSKQELAEALTHTEELLARPQSSAPLDLGRLVGKLKDAYEDDQLSTSELRRLAKELKRLREV